MEKQMTAQSGYKNECHVTTELDTRLVVSGLLPFLSVAVLLIISTACQNQEAPQQTTNAPQEKPAEKQVVKPDHFEGPLKHEREVNCVAFSPDGKTVITG
ncbi:MAG TPA: hypothetical protein DCM07_16220, partial [Planctomycetaceae bacterium]|nr:hypothetical protein [Planctomycetaceae bacterium]